MVLPLQFMSGFAKKEGLCDHKIFGEGACMTSYICQMQV